MPKPTIEKPKIKFVRKAQQWVKTYYIESANGKDFKMVQEWSDEKP